VRYDWSKMFALLSQPTINISKSKPIRITLQLASNWLNEFALSSDWFTVQGTPTGSVFQLD